LDDSNECQSDDGGHFDNNDLGDDDHDEDDDTGGKAALSDTEDRQSSPHESEQVNLFGLLRVLGKKIGNLLKGLSSEI
jgi:hypothetical protein